MLELRMRMPQIPALANANTVSLYAILSSIVELIAFARGVVVVVFVGGR